MEDVDWILWSESADALRAFADYTEDAMHAVNGHVRFTFDDWLLTDDAQRSYWEATV